MKNGEHGTAATVLDDKSWQSSYAGSIKELDDLSNFIPFLPEEKVLLQKVIKRYHMRITPYFLSLIKDPSDHKDPIRMQCVPSIEEINDTMYENKDPLGEKKDSATPFLVHRYPDRALLIVTGRCFMYCRHCTRKRLWRAQIQDPTLADIEKSLEYVKATPKVREIIISGGDPLTLPTERLDHILSAVSSIDSVEVMRIGTRAPVVLPQRIDDDLCKTLEKYKKLWVNVQFNHPNEITPQSEEALRKLQKCGIPINNQSVLLKGINDDPKTMTDLCHKLMGIRVRPYYLYECDPVVGASHFRTSVFKGIDIIEKMRGHTSGMCIPTFVVDGPEGAGKVPLGPNYLLSTSDNEITLRNYEFSTFKYHNPTD